MQQVECAGLQKILGYISGGWAGGGKGGGGGICPLSKEFVCSLRNLVCSYERKLICILYNELVK